MKSLNKLISIDEAVKLIEENKTLIFAGKETLLEKLPKGNWIGGTIPYFMDESGGCFSKEKIFVTDLSEDIKTNKIEEIDENSITKIVENKYSNGYSFLLIPGFSKILSKYAIDIQNVNGLFDNPVVGWVTGIDLANIGKETPKVFNGSTGNKFENKAVVMQIELTENKMAELEILNIFKQGAGDTFEFIEEGFTCRECLINGEKINLAEYIKSKNIDTRLPLVANYSGAMINISFQQVDDEKGEVLFYAPLRTHVKYKLAQQHKDYVKDFENMVPKNVGNMIFSCNCILNYLYSELEGKKTAGITGPFTFGEIAYVLVNQTMVYLNIIGS